MHKVIVLSKDESNVAKNGSNASQQLLSIWTTYLLSKLAEYDTALSKSLEESFEELVFTFKSGAAGNVVHNERCAAIFNDINRNLSAAGFTIKMTEEGLLFSAPKVAAEQSLSFNQVLQANSPSDTISKFFGQKTLPAAFREIQIISDPDDENDGMLVLPDGSLRKVIGCAGLNCLLMDKDKLDELAELVSDLVKSTQSDIQMVARQSMLSVDKFMNKQAYWQQAKKLSGDEYLSWFSDYHEKWFQQVCDVVFVSQREFYLVVQANADGARTSNAPNPVLTEILNQRARMVVSRLKEIHVPSLVLSRNQLRSLTYSCLHPSLNPDEAPSNPVEATSPLTISGPECTESREGLHFRNTLVRTQYLSELPPRVWTGWLADSLNLRLPCTLSVHLHHCEKTAVEMEHQDGAQKSIKMSVYISHHAKNEDSLRTNALLSKKVFGDLEAVVEQADGNHMAAWASTLPLGIDLSATQHEVYAPVAGSSWPFVTESAGTRNGIPVGFGVTSNEPVFLNPFVKGHNGNILVAGEDRRPVVLRIVLRLLALGVDAMVLESADKRDSAFSYLAEALGETCRYVNAGDDKGSTFNPFGPGFEEFPGAAVPSDTVELAISALEAILYEDADHSVGNDIHSHRELLEALVRQAYKDAEDRDIVPTLGHFVEVIGDFATDCDQETQTLLKKYQTELTSFIKATGTTFNGPTNIDLHRRLTIFNISKLSSERERRLVSLIVAHLLKLQALKAHSTGKHYAAVFDEIYELICSSSGQRVMSDLLIHTQNHGLQLISSSNELNKIVEDEELAKRLLDSHQIRILLPYNAPAREKLRSLTGLSQTAIDFVRAYNPAQASEPQGTKGILVVGNTCTNVRLVPSPMEYWLAPSPDQQSRRAAMLAEIKQNNPKLNHTDCCRQAIYYLSKEV